MTREETASFIRAYLDGDTSIGNIIPIRDVLESAIAYLKEQPYLPEGLDEAVEKIASDIAPTYPDINWDDCFERIKKGVKAGVQWLSDQCYTITAEVKNGRADGKVILNGNFGSKNTGDKVLLYMVK